MMRCQISPYLKILKFTIWGIYLICGLVVKISGGNKKLVDLNNVSWNYGELWMKIDESQEKCFWALFFSPHGTFLPNLARFAIVCSESRVFVLHNIFSSESPDRGEKVGRNFYRQHPRSFYQQHFKVAWFPRKIKIFWGCCIVRNLYRRNFWR